MFATNLKRTSRAGFVSFWRNKFVSLAAVLVITVTLFVIGSLILANAFFQSVLSQVKERVDISVYLKTDAAEADILALKKALAQLPTVKNVTYSSRDQEFNDFLERHKDNSLIIQSLEEVGNPFGARLNIAASDPSQYEGIAKFLEGDDALSANGETIIDHLSFKKNIVDRLLNLIGVFKRVGLALSGLLVFISILVTINTISLAIYSAREEISVMRLVGASNLYVQGPFIVEGAISGFLAAMAASALLYPATLWLRNATILSGSNIDIAAYYISNFGQIFLILVGTGVLLGIVASFLAVEDQIKV